MDLVDEIAKRWRVWQATILNLNQRREIVVVPHSLLLTWPQKLEI